MDDILADEFLALQQSGAIENYLLLDVREPLEFHTHNVGGINIPLGKLQNLISEDEIDFDTEQAIIVICQRGLRSKTAKSILNQNGFKNVRNLTGGLLKLRKI
ncbi:rhodanese-like domain-containing protein [Pedobacter aquae]|jgi:adenylyltransferase/sulfurtransferase|uniref:Rhodanese-like domain-containing protein n=1 Tax=Pedobacter aquae TaxID=2605747 RepID=A0A5C0VGA7_9SPHI|nr:rhodanese-like domain-containing protein [Pedobacter aquae]QEK51079.1 rhodanese-like domain-containing protein [Pedobacter aquae]